MPRRSRQTRSLLANEPPPKEFDARLLFPEHKGIPRGPLPKQHLIFDWLEQGICRGGGIVYQGSLGAAKSVGLCVANVWCHQRWPGLRSAVCRETYVSHLNSTYDEYRQVIDRMPPHFIVGHSAPTINSAGYIHWANGGVTMFLSLSNIEILASSNLGLLCVDEGHLQDGEAVDKAAERLRQTNGTEDDYPCTVLIASNPSGKSYFWRWANPKSSTRKMRWAWIESTMFENPALPQHYKDRMVEKFPPGTLGHKRWVLGKSTQIENIAFECFDTDPEAQMHVVPPFNIPLSWPRGRGLDFGLVDETVCVWGAMDPIQEVFWVYRTYHDNQLAASEHARRILQLERNDPTMKWTPSAPDMFRKVIPVPGSPRVFKTLAQEFREEGVTITIADNDRLKGFEKMLDMIAPDRRLIHPNHLKPPCPRLIILDTEDNQYLIEQLSSMEKCLKPKGGNVGARDDVKQVSDDAFDAIRYLAVALPRVGTVDFEPIRNRPDRRRGVTGYAGR